MKEYESKSKTYLNKKEPVIIRIDGKAFHTFTRGFHKPFDEILIKSMQETMKYLCENIQGCVLGYHQSDEISLVLVDYKNPDSSAWFDYKVQKCTSIAASMATMAFNKAFAHEVAAQSKRLYTEYLNDNDASYIDALEKAMNKGAMFDSRIFNLSKEEVTNCIYWRQLDAIRNSIQMVGQANFSHKELQNKSCNNIKEMLIDQKNIDWTSLPLYQQRGSCCIKEAYKEETEHGEVTRTRWKIDKNIPLFKGTDREYIEKLINFE
jgi:tRNA(His) 5'-end guanylyltransferase